MPGLYIKLPNNSWLVADGTETDPDPLEGLQELVPALLSNSSGGWICSASNEYYEAGTGTASAYKIFDRTVSGNWIDTWNAGYGYPQWNQFEAPAPITIKAYTVQIRKLANTLYPGAWTLQGWNGSSLLDIPHIDKFGNTFAGPSGLTWKDGEIKAFKIATPTPYGRHRFNVTAGGIQCEIAEVRLYG